jgi:hypothetical protein
VGGGVNSSRHPGKPPGGLSGIAGNAGACRDPGSTALRASGRDDKACKRRRAAEGGANPGRGRRMLGPCRAASRPGGIPGHGRQGGDTLK